MGSGSEQVLTAEQRIPLPLARVFDFFSRAENLGRITPPELRFRMVTEPPVEMRQGTRIDYTIAVLGFPLRWRSAITVWEPPRRFVDLQVRGPYALWEHDHTFRPDGAAATIMNDRVRYRLPFGPMGALARPIVRRQLEHIFDYRARIVGTLLA